MPEINRLVFAKAKSKKHLDDFLAACEEIVPFIRYEVATMSTISLHNQRKKKVYEHFLEMIEDYKHRE